MIVPIMLSTPRDTLITSQLDGTMNIKDRNAAVQSLSDPKSLVTVMLISLRCGSVGLNLTAANRVILLDVWWNPALGRDESGGTSAVSCTYRPSSYI